MINPDLKERLISTYLKTSKGRAKMIEASINPMRSWLELADHPGVGTPESLDNLKSLIVDMKRLDKVLDGTEDADLYRFRSQLADLQGLRDRLQGTIDNPPNRFSRI